MFAVQNGAAVDFHLPSASYSISSASGLAWVPSTESVSVRTPLNRAIGVRFFGSSFFGLIDPST